MRILAIDTSTMVSTVAVMDEDKVLSEISMNCKKNHSEKIIIYIDEAIKSTEYTLRDMDLFTCSIGPGSFTGLRIAIATVKGLAQSLNKPVMGISSLEALAFNIPNNHQCICPIIDAQRDEVYTAMYQWVRGELIPRTQERVVSIDALLHNIRETHKNVIFLGDGIYKIPENLDVEMEKLIQVAPISHRMLRASSIANLARIKREKGMVQNYSELLPNYMRKSQAEVQLELKQKNIGSSAK
ncbi:MAG: tRNA (adenosine(37)-N6)-threonylcarbamoyltransferase complex dimerization subunit type 1 TsaB [Eubacteriales bacterium]